MSYALRRFQNALGTTPRGAFWLCALSCLLLIGLRPAIAAAEEETHSFNATLSLTGSCSVSATIDPVPDPGCPDDKPPKPFTRTLGAAIDPYGDRYVVSFGSDELGGDPPQGRIDVFGPNGVFITEIKEVFLPFFRASIAVDSDGVIYVDRKESDPKQRVIRFEPTKYDPATGEIEYGSPVAVPNPLDPEGWAAFDFGPAIGVDPANDHVYISEAHNELVELTSAAEGNAFASKGSLEGITEEMKWVNSLAIDAAHNRIWVTDLDASVFSGGHPVVKAFSLEAPANPDDPYELLFTLDGSNTPTERFVSNPELLPVAADEATGHVFVADMQAPTRRVYEFDTDENLISTIGEGRIKTTGTWQTELAYDNSADSPTQGYLIVPSDSGPGRSLAFEPKITTAPPIVEALSVSGVTTSDAILRGKVNPGGVETTYRFEYTTETAFLANGFEGAILSGEGTLNPAHEGIAVNASVSGLEPGIAYRFRLVAESPEGVDEADFGFATLGAEEPFSACPNKALRTGPSAALPDCRAYELVTPPNTNGQAPLGTPATVPTFTNRQVSPEGEKLPFILRGSPLSGMEGTGGLNGDPYLATRTATGWSTTYKGPPASFAAAISPGTSSPDQGYSLWNTDGSIGPALIEKPFTSYLHYPDGHSELLGQGSLGTAYRAVGKLISDEGSHIIFSSGGVASPASKPVEQLEPDAAPDGTEALYDRTADGVLHVVSMKPGEAPFGAGEGAVFTGASLDGLGVAFKADGLLYLRRGETTYEGVPQALSAHQLTCAPGSVAGATPDYEWLRDGAPIPGANGPNYTPEPGDAGAELQCLVHAENAEGGEIGASSPLLVDQSHIGGPVPRGKATVSGDPSAGETLSCDTNAWSANPSLSFQWYRNGGEIVGAAGETYEVQAADEHTIIQCGVSATGSGATVVAFSFGREVEPPVPPSGPEPVLRNLTEVDAAPQLGDELECDAGSWQGEPTLSFLWLRDGTPIGGATASTYTVVAEDEGAALQCEVSGASPDGSREEVSPPQAIAPLVTSEVPSGVLKVDGIYAVGNTLECNQGTWQGGPTFSYRWLRNGTPIGGATASSYTLSAEDRETVVQCELTAENSATSVLALAGSFVNQKPRLVITVPPLQVGFAGVAEGGKRLFYAMGGDLWRFDTEGETNTRFSEVGDAIPVIVSPDGSTAFFLSKTAISGSGPNPEGDEPQAASQNLYLSREGQIHFIGTVTERDVKGEGAAAIDGLGLWLTASEDGALAKIPARVTSSGDTLLFKARAQLTRYDNADHAEIYRFDLAEGGLQCVSCNPTGATASADASLQVAAGDIESVEELGVIFREKGWLENVRADGRRAFFETGEGLVAADTDGLEDVYEWEEQGVGSCTKPNGCLYLISSGQSARDEHLWAVSGSGDDVFFFSSDLLTASDVDETPSIYDARVNGGFAPPVAPAGECLGEACQPAAVAPNDPTPASAGFEGTGNVPPETSPGKCPKGKHSVRRAGKRRCVRNHHGKKRKHRTNKKNHKKHANSNGRAGR